MRDALGREIDYLRISVTDRCNLRCAYCMPEGVPPVEHGQILRYEEILRICEAAVGLGIRDFKVTGGEPLARRDILGFLGRLTALPGARAVTLTTNGVLLAPCAAELAAMGLAGVNISLDTLNPATYLRLTGRDALEDALRGLRAAVGAGLRVKVNCVPIEGVNDGELEEIAALAGRYPVDVRFIELMPTRSGLPLRGVPGGEVLARLRARYPGLQPAPERRGAGPARYFRCEGLRGAIGLIDPLTGCFCKSCNRVRLTSEGVLKPCLFYGAGVSLRDLMRFGADDALLRDALREAIWQKPERHRFGADVVEGIDAMSRIGG